MHATVSDYAGKSMTRFAVTIHPLSYQIERVVKVTGSKDRIVLQFSHVILVIMLKLHV